MWPYIVTFIAVAVFPLALAGYGGHLATLALPENSKARRKALVIVWGLAIIGVVLFGVSQILSYRADKGRDGRDESFKHDVLRKLQDIINEPNAAKRREGASALQASIASSPPIESPIDGLTKLGWLATVDATHGAQFTFQQSSKPLPDMHKSARVQKV